MMEKSVFSGKDVLQAGIGLNQQMGPVFLGLLLAAALAWIFLSRRLYDVLRYGYPRIYEELGNPKLIMKSSLITNYRVIKFLVRRTYESTDDPEMIRLCLGLRYILFIYVISLLGCLILLIDKIS